MALQKKKTVLMAATIALLGAIGGLVYASRYLGGIRSLLNDLTYLSLHENTTVMRFSLYMAEELINLGYDAQTDTYDFHTLPNENDLGEYRRAHLAWHRGEFAKAVDLFKRDIKQNGPSEARLFWLGMSQMRQAEATNCLDKLLARDNEHTAAAPHAKHETADAQQAAPHTQHDHGTMCSLPLTAYHDQRRHSRDAAKTFERLLREYDDENRLYQWLMNFSYMTIDAFPDDVPKDYRISGPFIDHFYSDDTLDAAKGLRFTDRAQALGVATFDAGKGVGVEDFNGDGWLDLVTGGTFDKLVYYENQQGKGFLEKTKTMGLAGVTQTHIITTADYNNDGWIDIFAARPFHHYRLFRNDAGTGFTDVTYSSGLLSKDAPKMNYVTWVSAWGDVDNDGDLDLLMAQYGQRPPVGEFDRPSASSTLFINYEGKFHDATEAWGLHSTLHDQNFIGATFADYNGDDFADLYLASTYSRTSALFKNVDGKRFEPVPIDGPNNPGFTAAFVDIDHDGDLDLFKAGANFAQLATEASVFNEGLDDLHAGFSTMMLQTEGKFEQRPQTFKPAFPISTMGASFGDLNNDGCFDFYLGTGNPEGWFVLPNLMYLGERDGTDCTGSMQSISGMFGFGTIQKGHGIVFFDFDNDGDQDVYSSLGGMWPGDRWPNQLFVNDSEVDNTWLRIRLRGKKTNHFGLGARIKVSAKNAAGESIERLYTMTNKTGFGSAPYLAHIGLYNATEIEQVEVRWPASHTTRVYHPPLRALSILDEQGGVLLSSLKE